jgi:DNA-binding FadR family transcriptional regulator
MVSEIDVRLQLRLLEVRRELERLMASLAAERAIQEERREFTEVAEAMLAAAAVASDRLIDYRISRARRSWLSTEGNDAAALSAKSTLYSPPD